MTRILIVEDHALTLELIAQGVQQNFADIEEVVQADSVAKAKQLIKTKVFDIALIDINLTDGKGIELLPLLNAEPHKAECIMLTVEDERDVIVDCLKHGAQGYLLKNQHIDVIISELAKRVSDSPAITPSVTKKILSYLHKPEREIEHEIEQDRLYESLTGRQKDVLKLMAKGFTHKEIAKFLDISNYTVSDHVKAIYKKLNVNSSAEAIQFAVKHGDN
ncbi:response regulator transcription factor [Catenovulum sp. SM1970]|uniref:response regulator n=1 Tax=Marinifaba aquimaris TaxID=2741323 RepID=UPI0015738108|nr:response regulator transcription factor [Marinifaba aquimaris]NTS76769.1 response regulator transcription factor [Marinifaba aquimaris]